MNPLVSIVLPVKNGLPQLRATIDSLRRQTFRDFELIVEDGLSTDGTLEYLESVTDLPSMMVTSAADGGIGQAYDRGLKRCRGDYVCMLAADETLEERALDVAVDWFRRCPEAVFVNGSVRMIDAGGETLQVFSSPHFDLLSHLQCEVVLAFAGLLNRKKLGRHLAYDTTLKTCPDYDFWIRIGSRFPASQFVVFPDVFKTALADRTSMSFRAETYEQFCSDKLLALKRFLADQPDGPLVEAVRNSATAGIHLWAAESVLSLQGPSLSFARHCIEAARLTPWAPRLSKLADRSGAFALDDVTGAVVKPPAQLGQPATETTFVPGGVRVEHTFVDPSFPDSHLVTTPYLRVETSPLPWAYSAIIPITHGAMRDDRYFYWVKLRVNVESGQAGFGLLSKGEILHERILNPMDGDTCFYVKVSVPDAEGIVIRNGELKGTSHVRLIDAGLERSLRPGIGSGDGARTSGVVE